MNPAARVNWQNSIASMAAAAVAPVFTVGRLKTDVFFFQAEDGIRDVAVTGVQTCALPIWNGDPRAGHVSSECVPQPVRIGLGNVTSLPMMAKQGAQAGRSHRLAPTWAFQQIGRASCRERV